MPCNLQLTTYSKMTLTHSVTMKRPPTNGPHSFPLFKRSKDRNSLEKRLELNFAVIVIASFPGLPQILVLRFLLKTMYTRWRVARNKGIRTRSIHHVSWTWDGHEVDSMGGGGQNPGDLGSWLGEGLRTRYWLWDYMELYAQINHSHPSQL